MQVDQPQASKKTKLLRQRTTTPKYKNLVVPDTEKEMRKESPKTREGEVVGDACLPFREKTTVTIESCCQ